MVLLEGVASLAAIGVSLHMFGPCSITRKHKLNRVEIALENATKGFQSTDTAENLTDGMVKGCSRPSD